MRCFQSFLIKIKIFTKNSFHLSENMIYTIYIIFVWSEGVLDFLRTPFVYSGLCPIHQKALLGCVLTRKEDATRLRSLRSVRNGQQS